VIGGWTTAGGVGFGAGIRSSLSAKQGVGTRQPWQANTDR
jgi:hypothetical protein